MNKCYNEQDEEVKVNENEFEFETVKCVSSVYGKDKEIFFLENRLINAEIN